MAMYHDLQYADNQHGSYVRDTLAHPPLHTEDIAVMMFFNESQ